MRLYNAMATGTLEDAETALLQLYMHVTGSTRAKVVAWDVSFDGLVAGNSLTFRIVRDGSYVAPDETTYPAVLDGSFFDGEYASGPEVNSISSLPSVGSVIEGPLYVADSSHVFRQYGSGKELTLDNFTRTSLRCTPSDMLVPVKYKVNFIFWA